MSISGSSEYRPVNCNMPGDSGISLPRVPGSCELKYELPSTVSSVRDGWQWTSQSGAVVSGLLAAVASQLLSFFKQATNMHQGVHDFVVASCYAALFLNIGATITSFILIDNLGEIGYHASSLSREVRAGERMTTTQDGLLKEFGASPMWRPMLLYWLFTFYSGILALIISTLAFVIATEPKSTWITMSVIVAIIVIPSAFFILVHPILERRSSRERSDKEK